MELRQLRCFIAAAEELHFGRAAQRLDMLPSALGRNIRLLEEVLGTRLMARTTRNVALTTEGATLLEEGRELIIRTDNLVSRFRTVRRNQSATLNVGAIDTAAAGLIPLLLHDFRKRHRGVEVHLLEDKTRRLLPRLLSGRIDLAFVRPPEHPDKRLEFQLLFHETAVVAVPTRHKLGSRKRLSIEDLADQPLIVPERQSRPHSHDVTVRLFADAGLRPKIAQVAEQKQTIVNLVAANVGVAIVPRWTSRMAISGVRYIPLKPTNTLPMNILPLAAAWVRGSRDTVRDEMMAMLHARLKNYAFLA